jgi:hypothetical protein
MAQQLVTDAGVLIVPGAYAKTTVQTTPAGLAVNGVLAIVGEGGGGPSFDEESDLTQNLYGPDQIGDIEGKYLDGAVVDAARVAAAASNDPDIVGSFNRILVVKTNTGVKSTGTLSKIGGGTYANIAAKSAGKKGNLISRSVVQRVAESLPTTGATVLVPPQVSTVVAFRVNGGSEVTTTLAASSLPSAMVSTLNAVAGVAATGGANRGVLTAGEIGDNLTLAVVSGYAVSIETDAVYAAVPVAGDILYIPTGSPFAAANEGSYVITSASTTKIYAYKLRDAAGTGASLTAPSGATVAIAAATDMAAFSPITMTQEAGVVVPGLGKSLEIAESGSNFFHHVAFTFAGATAAIPAATASWVSTLAAPYAIASAAEYAITMTVARQSDLISESLGENVNGDVVLTLGYKGTSGSAVIASGVLTITVVGGAGATPDPITLADYATVGDLVSYIGSLTGFTAAAGNAALSQRSPSDLDAGTYGIGSTMGAAVGRIKTDGAKLLEDVNTNSVLLSLAAVTPATKLVGLPDVSSLAFLTGGSRGATTDARVLAALTALEACRVNFVIPLFSRDATSDISDGITDTSSTYTIASVNANLRSHVLLMSQMKRRRRRQGFASYRGAYTGAKAQAGNLATQRVALFFQDIRDVGSNGALKQIQPWSMAVKAAAMQAAGFYRPIVNKFINCSGVIQAAGDFNDQLDSALEDALLAGLCPAQRDVTGGFRFVSDQTTYSKDDNFVFNSIQATYVSDVIAASTEQRMERAFVGKSVADVNKALALTTMEGILDDMRRLKLIAPSDDAPKGYLPPKVRLEGPALRFSATVKLAGAIYFVTVDFLLTPVQQSG